RRQDALALAADVDAGLLTEAELLQVVVDAIHAHHVRDVPEVDIARGRDRLAHVDAAVAFALPVAAQSIAPARHAPAAAAEASFLRRHDPVLERGQRHQRFDRRSWRIDAA